MTNHMCVHTGGKGEIDVSANHLEKNANPPELDTVRLAKSADSFIPE